VVIGDPLGVTIRQVGRENNARMKRNMDGNTIFRDPSARNPDFEGIIFTDALDRRMDIPFEYCTTWEVIVTHSQSS
jgi:hypothetical protein